MKLNRSILLSVLALFVLAVPSAFAGGHGKGCCGGDAMAWKQDAKFEVLNLNDGVRVTVTSDKPEAVQAIQEHVTACDGSCCAKSAKDKPCKCKGCQDGDCKCKGCKDGNCTCKGCKDKACKCKGGNDGSRCGGKCCGKADMAWKKDAKFETARIADGAILTVTTANADAVQDLQAHFANMGACKHAKEKKGKAGGHRHGHGCPHQEQS